MSQFESEFVKRVDQHMFGTGEADIWTPAAGMRIVLKGCALRARVVSSMAASTPGTALTLMDGNYNELAALGVCRTAADAAGTDYGFVYFDLPGGYQFPNANSPLKLVRSQDGQVKVTGLVWGDEIPGGT